MVTRVKNTARQQETDKAVVDRQGFSEFESYLKIDRDALDEALLEQSDLFYRVSKAYAMAVSRRDKAKMEYELVIAECTSDIRAKAPKEKDEGKRLTKDAVAAEVQLMQPVMDAERLYLHHREVVDRWLALKEGFQQRSFMLRELCGLYTAGYFGNAFNKSSAVRDAQERNADRVRDEAGALRERRSRDE